MTKIMDLVSVVIVNYNTFEITCNCISSILRQTRAVDYEIVVVDNASSECPPERFLQHFPDIRLVKNRENKGFARACNDGIRHSSGNYILLLNSDTILLNDAISIVYNFLRENGRVGVATCHLKSENGTTQNNCQAFISFFKIIGEALRIHKLFPERLRGKIWWGPYFKYNEIAYPDWVWGTFLMFPRKILNIFPDHMLTETFWMYLEDMEWCWLVQKAGYKIAFIPEGKVLHYGGGHRHSEKTRMTLRNNMRQFLCLYYPKPYASVLLFLIKILNWSQFRK